MEDVFRQNNLKLEVIGLESNNVVSDHPLSTCRRVFEKIKGIVILADSGLQLLLEQEYICRGVRMSQPLDANVWVL